MTRIVSGTVFALNDDGTASCETSDGGPVQARVTLHRVSAAVGDVIVWAETPDGSCIALTEVP